jgi:hypothetical protein
VRGEEYEFEAGQGHDGRKTEISHPDVCERQDYIIKGRACSQPRGVQNFFKVYRVDF